MALFMCLILSLPGKQIENKKQRTKTVKIKKIYNAYFSTYLWFTNIFRSCWALCAYYSLCPRWAITLLWKSSHRESQRWHCTHISPLPHLDHSLPPFFSKYLYLNGGLSVPWTVLDDYTLWQSCFIWLVQYIMFHSNSTILCEFRKFFENNYED